MTGVTTQRVDVIVIGAGPAGLSGAATLAAAGRRVLLIDSGLRVGGQVWRHRDQSLLPPHARRWLARVRDAGVMIASRARVVDVLSSGEIAVEADGSVRRVAFDTAILATGARERFLPFPGWTLPGVVGIGGLQALLKGGLILDGSRVVIAGSGPLLLPVASAVASAGAHLLRVAEQTQWRSVLRFAGGLWTKPGAVLDALRYRWAFRHAPYRTGTSIVRADGRDRVERVVLACGPRITEFPCDWLAVGGGLVANTDVASLFGCTIARDAIAVDDAQRTSVGSVFAAGDCTGIKGDAAAIVEGELAALIATGSTDVRRLRRLQRRRRTWSRFAATLERCFAPSRATIDAADPDTVVCRCENVRWRELDPTWSQRQAKLWTRIGMGECQGAVCGPACASLFGWDLNSPRPPLHAPTCGAWSVAITSGSPSPDE